jgi:hypothetical protein
MTLSGTIWCALSIGDDAVLAIATASLTQDFGTPAFDVWIDSRRPERGKGVTPRSIGQRSSPHVR